MWTPYLHEGNAISKLINLISLNKTISELEFVFR